MKMSCVTSRTTRDDIERLKEVLIRKGQNDRMARVRTEYSEVTHKRNIPLTNESFLLCLTYPALNDLLILCRIVCRLNGTMDCVRVAHQMHYSSAKFVDVYFATLFAAWISINQLEIDDAISLSEETAKDLMNKTWTHAPSHTFATSQLPEAVKINTNFVGVWDTRKLAGAKISGHSIRSMVDNLAYAGEPVYDVLNRLKAQRFTNYDKRCASDLREKCFEPD